MLDVGSEVVDSTTLLALGLMHMKPIDARLLPTARRITVARVM